MTTILLIAALHLHILWSENPAKDCFSNSELTGACYIDSTTKTIIMGYQTPDFLLDHELGHASGIDEDREVRKVVDKFPAIRPIDKSAYPTPELREKEKIADWFAFYLTNEGGARDPHLFQEDFPTIYNIFTKKVNQIVK